MSSRIFKGSFNGPQDEYSGQGKRPVVFDVIGPDGVTSLLPSDTKMVLHVNPEEMKFSYEKIIERIQTEGGWVEQHYGEGVNSISCSASTGGFMRLYTGLSNVTGGPGALDLGGTRRDTLAYESYLDIMSLFHHNGSIYDSRGNVVYQGSIKCSFDGGVWLGWFSDMSVDENADKPYQFSLSWNFVVEHEFIAMRTQRVQTDDAVGGQANATLEQRFDEAEALQQEREEASERFLLGEEVSPSETTPGFDFTVEEETPGFDFTVASEPEGFDFTDDEGV